MAEEVTETPVEETEQEEVRESDDLLPETAEQRVMRLIREVDPDWQPGDTTQHLDFRTGRDGSLLQVSLAMSPAAVKQLRRKN